MVSPQKTFVFGILASAFRAQRGKERASVYVGGSKESSGLYGPGFSSPYSRRVETSRAQMRMLHFPCTNSSRTVRAPESQHEKRALALLMLGAVGPVKLAASQPKGRGTDHPAAGL